MGAFVQSTISHGSKQNDIAGGKFVSSSGSRLPEPSSFVSFRRNSNSNKRESTELYSFMGSDGGLFGIGTPELVSKVSGLFSLRSFQVICSK